MLAIALAMKVIWRSRYGRGRVVMIVTAIAATMVGRMARKEDEVLGSQEDIRESQDFFFRKIKKYNDSYATHQFVKALVINDKRCTNCK